MWTYILPDGTLFPLQIRGSRFVMSEEGLGMPELEYIMQRGPFQHGETYLDYFLRPRVIQFLVRARTTCYDKYYRERARYLDALRPNRGEGTLRAVLPGSLKRDIKVFVQQGPDFEKVANRGWDEWSFSTTLRFVAHDPVFYDPAPKSISASLLGGLEFPITFPITFTVSGLTAYIAYIGTWLTYPTIELTGPMDSAVITNVTTGEVLSLVYTLAIGEVVTFSLQTGVKTIVSNTAGSVLGYLSSSSDLATFHMDPGLNQITIAASGTGAATWAAFTWYDRYIGLGGQV